MALDRLDMACDARPATGEPQPALSALCALAIPEILGAVADALHSACERNEPLGRGAVTRFHAKDRPATSIETYLVRLLRVVSTKRADKGALSDDSSNSCPAGWTRCPSAGHPPAAADRDTG